jgi:hypothetical protein
MTFVAINFLLNDDSRGFFSNICYSLQLSLANLLRSISPVERILLLLRLFDKNFAINLSFFCHWLSTLEMTFEIILITLFFKYEYRYSGTRFQRTNFKVKLVNFAHKLNRL